MPGQSNADTIRILISSDNHVGYAERDPERGDDSWKSFHEVMCLAKDNDVDMVLLAGDLFHDNKPSRKSIYQVMRSLRMNCYGDKPCELEMLSDGSENFSGAFNYVNYEDENLNVAIPVFSIHGNHDDPSGEGHLSALDILQMSGLINYYGRTPESDKIQVKPVLLQKGRTKLALYGLSNVRDERLFRTFRDGNVKFFQPGTQKENWFNLLSVHQNHPNYSDTNYLPENMLPDFIDMVVWGHEHECKIDPKLNPETNFHVMQPGSTIATSLVPGEAVPKRAAILKITGKQFESETIRLKTVRPFVYRDISLRNQPGMKSLARQDNNAKDVSKHLIAIIKEMVQEARQSWHDRQDELEDDDDQKEPKPLVRLRVDYNAPEGGKYECENPQRFSSQFQEDVANCSDVVQFVRKKASSQKAKDGTELPAESILDQITLDSIKVEKLVREYLTAQSLTILPQNSFGDAVSQFVDKDDKHAMEMFVSENLANQIKHLLSGEDMDEDNIAEAMESYRSQLEELFAAGHLKNVRMSNLKPRPDYWDSDIEGPWEDDPASRVVVHNGEEDEGESNLGSAPQTNAARRGRGRGRAAKSTGTGRAATTAARAGRATAAKSSRSKKQQANDDDDDEDDDDEFIMIDDEDVQPATSTQGRASWARQQSPKKTGPARSSNGRRQTRLNFSQPASQNNSADQAGLGRNAVQEISDDEISDDDDAFEPMPRSRRGR